MSRKVVLASAVLIWVCIKLPQEWWIHIAKLDVTESIASHPWVLVPLAVGAVAILSLAWWIVFRKAPLADRLFRLRSDPLPAPLAAGELQRMARARSPLFDLFLSKRSRFFNLALTEKAVLVALIIVIFSQIMPHLEARPLALWVSVATFVMLQALASQALARRGRSWQSAGVEFAVMIVVNSALVVAVGIVDRVLRLPHVSLPLEPLLFVIFLETLLIVLFDRFHTVYALRPFLRQLSSIQQWSGTRLRKPYGSSGIV